MRLLEPLGYTRIEHFAGGMQEWQEAGMPLERAGDSAPAAPSRVEIAHPESALPSRADRWHTVIDLFERRSTADLALSWFGTIVACAIVYWGLSALSVGGLREGGQVIGGGVHGLLTALYFSFVTATSVGFGDVVPLGPVRALAIIEAVVGLSSSARSCETVSRQQEHVVRSTVCVRGSFERWSCNRAAVQGTWPNVEQIRARLESASGLALAELRTIHDLLYRPQSLPEEALLEGILASLAILLRELRELLRCVTFERSAYLKKNLEGVSRYAEEICSDCVPRRYAPHLREWMDAIKATAPDLV